jgi:amino acid transporter
MNTKNLPLGGFLGLKIGGISLLIALFFTLLYMLGITQSKYIIYLAIVVGLIGVIIHFAIMLLVAIDNKEGTNSYYNKLSQKISDKNDEKETT